METPPSQQTNTTDMMELTAAATPITMPPALASAAPFSTPLLPATPMPALIAEISTPATPSAMLTRMQGTPQPGAEKTPIGGPSITPAKRKAPMPSVPAPSTPAPSTPTPSTPTPSTPSTPTPSTTPSPTATTTNVNFRLKSTLEGHTQPVCSVKFSPNSRWLASCSADATVRIWALNGQLHKVLEDKTNGHTMGISDVVWSFDSLTLATCSDDKTLKVWDFASGQVTQTLIGHSGLVLCLDAHPKQPLLVSGSDDTKIIVWSAAQGKPIKIIQAHSESVSSVSYNREGTLVVSGSYDGTCKIWNAETYELVKVLSNFPDIPVSCARFAPNGKILLIGMMDSSLKLYTDEGNLLRSYQGHKNVDYCLFVTMFVRAVAKLVVSGSEDGSVFIWNLQNKQILQTLENAHTAAVLALDAHPRLNYLATGGMDNVVKIWVLQ